MMKSRSGSSIRRSLPIALPLVAVVAVLRMLPPQPDAVDRPPLAVVEDGHPVVGVECRPEDAAALDTFEAWLRDGRHRDDLDRGIALARERRIALRQLIQLDPREALQRAVPDALRRQLPEALVALLEQPISTTADLVVEQACGGTGGRSLRRRWLMHDGQPLRVFTYGTRAGVMTKEKLSVHGISIDDVMAMRDDPLREWSADEVAARGLTGRVAQLGGRLFAVESDTALQAARQRLRETEGTLGPTALPAYRQLALGGMDGMLPIAMQDGAGGSDDDLPPVAFSPWTEGAKTMLYIRARFADEAPGYEPVTLANAQANQGRAEAFWRENSYGKSLLTTTYTDVVTLPGNGGKYLGNFNALLVDARQAAVAANPAWNHNNFSFYTIVTNQVAGGGFGYIGIAQLGGPGSHLLRNFISVRTASHEFGHNLGLQHSGYWLTDSPSPIGADSRPGGYAGDDPDDERNEYGHKFAVMGSQDASPDFENGRVHYAVGDKTRLDWLAPSDGDVASITTSGTVRLHRHDVPAAGMAAMTPGVARAVKIDRPATDPTGLANPYKYWLNYRMLPTDGIAGNWLPHGVQVDWRRDGGTPRAVLLDMSPYSRDSGPYGASPGQAADNDDKEDSVLLIGRTHSDTGADIHFTPVARGGASPNEWLDVVVNIGTQAGNTAPLVVDLVVANPNPAVGEVVDFRISASDADGDSLAYHWDMGDNTIQSAQLNLPTRGKAWTTAGYYVVRCEVSDMKGGKTSVSRVIRVGNPSGNGMIHGRVTHAGRPVEGALVRGGGLTAWTDSDGGYILAGLPLGGTSVTAAKAGLSFTSRLANPVQVTELNAFGIDFSANEPWTGGGGSVALVTPGRIVIPLGFAAQFSAQAFDGAGDRVEFAPAWSVSGGGVIDANGVFLAQTLGGPFLVTAGSGALTATAEVTVVAGPAGPADSGVWINRAGGSWGGEANWSGGPPGVIAGGPGNTADFSALDLAADSTVTLDAARVIGSLAFGDTGTGSAAGWTLAPGTQGTLTLAGAMPTIMVKPLAPGKFATITARLHGMNGFTKTGSGNLLLNNAGNPISGAVVLSEGNIQLNSAALSNATTVDIDAGTLVVATSAPNAIGGTIAFGGGTLQFNQNPGTDHSGQFSTAPGQRYRISLIAGKEAVFGSKLSSAGGSLTKLGAGTLTLAAANSHSGGTILSGGTLRTGHPGALAGGPLSFAGNSTLQTGGPHTIGNEIIIGSGVTATVDTDGNNAACSGALTGSGNLAKTGDGILNLSGGGPANTASGAILVHAGTLAIDNVTPSPGIQSFANMNGGITVASGACFNFSQSFTAHPLDNPIHLSGQGTGGLGALHLWRNATVTGTITLGADATISHNYNNATISGPIIGADCNLTLVTTVSTQPGLWISGPVQLGRGGITVEGAGGTNIVTLAGSNTYTGDTRVRTGTLRMTESARFDDASTVVIDAGAVLQLDFPGDDRVAALVLDGSTMPDGTYGSPSSAAANRSTFFSGTGILQVGAAADYDSWSASRVPPVTGGPNGDADHDGVENLVEYALADGGEHGVLTGTVITFTKRGAPHGGDLTYIIETSESLGNGSWSPAVTHGPDHAATSISHDLAPREGGPRKFARLRVVKSP